MSEEVDDFLEHFGVKGMHWGQRKIDTSVPLTKNYHGLNRKPTNAEIINARKERAVVGQQVKAEIKEMKKGTRTNFSEYVLDQTLATDHNVAKTAAVYKTTGEKIAATILAGPVGAYLYSDMRWSTREMNTKASDYVRKYGVKSTSTANKSKKKSMFDLGDVDLEYSQTQADKDYEDWKNGKQF